MSADFTSLPSHRAPHAPAVRRLRLPSRSLVLRTLLIAGLLPAMAFAAALADASAYAAAEPELVLLLRGMAVIKAGMALAALGLAFWRLGQPVSLAAASGYLLGIWALGGATVSIALLSHLPAAAGLFHIAVFGLIVLAWREDRTGAVERALG